MTRRAGRAFLIREASGSRSRGCLVPTPAWLLSSTLGSGTTGSSSGSECRVLAGEFGGSLGGAEVGVLEVVGVFEAVAEGSVDADVRKPAAVYLSL